MDHPVVACLTYTADCGRCGARLVCQGVQGLIGDVVRWDVESTCDACGSAMAVCGGVLPSELRDRLLTECGPATLRVADAPTTRVTILRVLRGHLGVGLPEAKELLHRVLAGRYSATLPEAEHLARALRAAGIDAAASG